VRRWLWNRRRFRAEYWLFVLSHRGDEQAGRAWYELVKPEKIT
jgi:hypothetical protein